MSAPAGWYPYGDRQRWWDGEQWLDYYESPPPDAAPPPPPPTSPSSSSTWSGMAIAAEGQPSSGSYGSKPGGPRPWWKKKRYLLPGGAAALLMIGAALTAPPDEEAGEEEAGITAGGESTDDTSGFYQPRVEAEGDSGPFWQTTFGLIVPEGHWEPVVSDVAEGLCRLVDEESYQLRNDRRVEIAPFDQAPTLVFGRSDSKVVDANCRVRVVTMGDYVDDLGELYTVSNGVLEAVFDPEELFSGQDDGRDVFQQLTPDDDVSPDEFLGSTTSTSDQSATSSTGSVESTSTTAPSTTQRSSTTAPTTGAIPTTAEPATTVAPTTASTTTTPASTSTAVNVVTPGAFCSPPGATGQTSNGTPMVCATTNAEGVPYDEGRARWRSP